MKRALLSVSDKTGLIDFAKTLVDVGFELVSTGGTARALREAGLQVKDVSEITMSPEMLDGRVKTLHPRVHGAILARNTREHMATLAQFDITPIDVVVVNLYPFERTAADPAASLEDLIENIDIGGPTMIRSAAKNVERVTVVVDPADYEDVAKHLQEDTLDYSVRAHYMQKAFAHTAHYDSVIASTLAARFGEDPLGENYSLTGTLVEKLRYGENPHQAAAFYRTVNDPGTIAHATQHQGKALSYNNIMDSDAAWSLVNEFTTTPACAIIKHTNPCGLALGETIDEAYERALAADPVSAFGGIVAMNARVTKTCAEKMVNHFFEAVIAPSYEPDALAVFEKKKNLRILETGAPLSPKGFQIRVVSGGFLVQELDPIDDESTAWTVLGPRALTQAEWADIHFAWKAVKHVKSNAIVIAKDGVTWGVGAGQMNRVGSVDIALKQADSHAQGSVLASDAFFPFADSVELAHAKGVSIVVQPGGSIRDEEVFKRAQELGLIMVITGRRHFKH